MTNQDEKISFQKALVAEFRMEGGKAVMTSVRVTSTMYRSRELAEQRYGVHSIVGMVNSEQTSIEFDATEVAHREYRFAGVVALVVQNDR